MTGSITSEASIERAVCARAKACGWLPIKLGGPGDRGKPDRLFIGPGGQVIFAEFKRPGRKPTKLQQWFIGRLRDMQHRAVVIDNVEAGHALFE